MISDYDNGGLRARSQYRRHGKIIEAGMDRWTFIAS